MNKKANPIYFTGFTYAKFLNYASMWTALLEDLPQLLVLLVVAGLHRHQDEQALKDAFGATHVESQSGGLDDVAGDAPSNPRWVSDPGPEGFWIADFSVPYSEGLCKRVDHLDDLRGPHFDSSPLCCEVSFQGNARTKCLERVGVQRGLMEDVSNAEWFFWMRMATSFLSILYTLYQWKYTNIRKEMEKERLSERADENTEEYSNE